MIDYNDFIVKIEDAKSSRKLYKMTCIKCGISRGYQRKSKLGLGMCRSCVSSHIHLNKTVSTETKLKMSQSNHLKNGGIHHMQGKKHKLSTLAKLSKAASKQNKNYIAKYVYSGPNGNINMKSSWEVKYANWLDSNNISWTYEPHFILSNGYWYLPDFQLSTGDIIEIKGYMRSDAQIKWDLFCKDYPDLNKSLIRKLDMKRIGLI